MVATDPPNQRDWIQFDDPRAAGSDADVIKVMSWNSLCDYSATYTQFGYTPEHARSWDHRKDMIVKEITGLNPDIVCLQEIDNDNFHNWFRPQLAIEGYKGFYWPRTRFRTMAEKDQKRVDGCAMFYKDHKSVVNIHCACFY